MGVAMAFSWTYIPNVSHSFVILARHAQQIESTKQLQYGGSPHFENETNIISVSNFINGNVSFQLFMCVCVYVPAHAIGRNQRTGSAFDISISLYHFSYIRNQKSPLPQSHIYLLLHRSNATEPKYRYKKRGIGNSSDRQSHTKRTPKKLLHQWNNPYEYVSYKFLTLKRYHLYCHIGDVGWLQLLPSEDDDDVDVDYMGLDACLWIAFRL